MVGSTLPNFMLYVQRLHMAPTSALTEWRLYQNGWVALHPLRAVDLGLQESDYQVSKLCNAHQLTISKDLWMSSPFRGKMQQGQRHSFIYGTRYDSAVAGYSVEDIKFYGIGNENARGEKLSLFSFDGVETVPEWLGSLTSLKELRILSCNNLKSLPSVQAMQHLTNLQTLYISGCHPHLKE
ncbi:hypothetical protein DVH24_041814 [Malus domestica]|uniref:R13L1/DRL21-like LRR repeat region domain-containing protein n=1 Tax=Malus domestica TaxID=3750 RepID=A0A498INW1_MALDO|nr:hypothetical protein DVH24_041814 [Malus domestica]